MFKKIANHPFPKKIKLATETALFCIIFENIGGFLGFLTDPNLLYDLFLTAKVTIHRTDAYLCFSCYLRNGNCM